MEVTINQSHIEGGYMNPYGCPLFKAIKEQHPDFPIEAVGGSGVLLVNKTTNSHRFLPSNADVRQKEEYSQEDMDKSWGYATFLRMKEGQVASVTIQIVEI